MFAFRDNFLFELCAYTLNTAFEIQYLYTKAILIRI